MGLVGRLAQPKVAVCRRPRLEEVFDRARARSILWIAGPAGSGKSTALSNYLGDRDLGCLWYTVDARDHDVANLFHVLDQHFQEQDAHPPQSKIPLHDPTGALAFTRQYFDALFARLSPPFWLVFDDCHLLPRTHRWFELLREGMDLLPEGVQVALISRQGPPPAFARFQAASRLALIGWEQLRFSTHEATDLVRARSKETALSLTPLQVSALVARADGWAAGLILALERARLDPHKLADDHAIISPALFDYFAAEVFAAVKRDDREFLLKSALIPTMAPKVLDQLFEGSDTLSILARLERDNFFITTYATPSSVCYRYHPLFREFLLSRFEQELPVDEAQAVCAKTAAILDAHGEVDAAFELYHRARDAKACAALVLREAPDLLSQGRSQTVENWIERLPAAFLEENAWLGFWSGMTRLGHAPLKSIPVLEAVLHRFDAVGDRAGYWAAWCALVQAHAFAGTDYHPLGPLIGRAEVAFARGFEPPSEVLVARVTRMLVMAMHLHVPAHPDFHVHVERLLSSPCRDAEDLWIAGIALGTRGFVSGFQLLEEFRDPVLDPDAPVTLILWFTTTAAIRALLAADFSRCVEIAQTGIDATERMGFLSHTELILLYAAVAHAALGDGEGFDMVTKKLAARGQRSNLFGSSAFHYAQSLAALRRGEFDQALQSSRLVCTQTARLGMPFGLAAGNLTLLEAFLGLERFDEALAHLEEVRHSIQQIGPIFAQAVLLVEAELALALRQFARMDELLDEAFELGLHRGFYPVFSPHPAALASLCRRALHRSIEPDYAQEILRRFSLEQRSKSGIVYHPRSTAAPPEFSEAVRRALRNLHEIHKLTQNSLLCSSLVTTRTLETKRAAVFELQLLLRERIDELQHNDRTQAWYQALFHTFVEPAGNQLLAAERAHLSFGSYRRHLASGVAEIVSGLWLSEGEVEQREVKIQWGR